MFKLPDQLYSASHYTSPANKYSSEFEPEDVNVWTKIIQDLHSNSSISNKTFLLNREKFSSQMKLIQSAVRNLELKLHLLDSTLSSIKEFVTEVIDPYVKILSAYIEQHLIDVQQHHYALNYIFAYCFIWAYVHPIHSKYEQQVNTFTPELLKSYDFPSTDCKLTDLYPNMSSSSARFVLIHLWLKSRQISYDCIPEFSGPMRLMSILISSNYPIGLYTHEQGFGKTTLMKRLLSDHLRIVSTGESPSLLRDEIFEHNLPIFTHGKLNRGTKFVIWMEDVKHEDVESIRSWIDEHSSEQTTGFKFCSYR